MTSAPLSPFVSKYYKHHQQERNSPESHAEKGCIHSSAPRFAQLPLGSPKGAAQFLQVITGVLANLGRGWDFGHSAMTPAVMALLGLCCQGGFVLRPWQGERALRWAVHQYNACSW